MRSNKMIKMQGLAAFKSQYWLSVLTYVIAAAAISVLSGSFNVEFKTDMLKTETINVIMPFAAAAVSVFSIVALAAKIALVPISYGYKKVLPANASCPHTGTSPRRYPYGNQDEHSFLHDNRYGRHRQYIVRGQRYHGYTHQSADEGTDRL